MADRKRAARKSAAKKAPAKKAAAGQPREALRTGKKIATPAPKPLPALPGVKLREANGFLFIGDPHLSKKKPGRRKDARFDEVVLGKLLHAIEIANKLKLIPVILGDLFDRPYEDDESLKARLLRVLKKAWTRIIILVGNHDRANAILTDGDTLAVIAESDNLVTVVKHSGPIEEFLVGEQRKRIALGGTPHGQDFPADVRPLFPEAERVIWLSHHDIEFEGAYPGSMPAVEIKGCSLVVNGHMHLTKPPITAGETVWFNPGNITRQKIDAIDHIPQVWELNGEAIVPHEIPHEKDVFDLTGKLVDAVSPGEQPHAADEERKNNLFVSLLQQEASTDLAKSDDGTMLLDEIMKKFEAEGTEPEVRQAVLGLLRTVTKAQPMAGQAA
jgi:hypothetical protein